MAKRRVNVLCPLCGHFLMSSIGTCHGVILNCTSCNCSTLIDIEESGKTVVSCIPVYSKETKIQKSIQQDTTLV